MGIPLESAFQQLLQNDYFHLPPIKDEPLTKPSWWDDNKYCEYHHTKGHKTTSCFQLKHAIQDLIDDGVIVLDATLTSNADHTIFKDPLASHDKGQASSSNAQSNVNYTHTGHNYTINFFRESDSRISTFTLKREDPCCAMAMRRNKITLLGASAKPTTPSQPVVPTKPTSP